MSTPSSEATPATAAPEVVPTVAHVVAVEIAQRVGGAQSTFRDNERIVVPAEKVRATLALAKSEFGFEMLVDITAVDYLEKPGAVDRFGVVYSLANYTRNIRLYIKSFVNLPGAELPTVSDLWRGANWMEREVYDMFGITFAGHPDPRRILMPDEFADFPLRKDFPLKGRGERHNFPVLTRAES